MWGKAILAAAAVALLAPAPASALQNKIVLVAYGEGTTTCTVTANTAHRMFWGGEQRYDFMGRTECSVPLEQTGQATLSTAVGTASGALCSGFRATCSSSGDVQGEEYAQGVGSVRYRVTLRAPLGQGWLNAPESCAGVGTDNLTCTFTSLSSQDTLIANND